MGDTMTAVFTALLEGENNIRSDRPGGNLYCRPDPTELIPRWVADDTTGRMAVP